VLSLSNNFYHLMLCRDAPRSGPPALESDCSGSRKFRSKITCQRFSRRMHLLSIRCFTCFTYQIYTFRKTHHSWAKRLRTPCGGILSPHRQRKMMMHFNILFSLSLSLSLSSVPCETLPVFDVLQLFCLRANLLNLKMEYLVLFGAKGLKME